ncbi:Delta24(24(1))-sterol reductase, partial [Lecanoromycetidae sp. Uapishka_2]
MVSTRGQLGETPRKTEHPDYVETPGTAGRRRGPRKSIVPSGQQKQDYFDASINDNKRKVRTSHSDDRKQTTGRAAINGTANGHAKAPKKGKDPRIDDSGFFEFGGDLGVSAMMIIFPLLMYYMWIGQTYYGGKLPLPQNGESKLHFLTTLGDLAYGGAFPTLKAWIMYWGFLIFQAVCYLYLPGVTAQGKPLKHEGDKKLTYYCSGVWSFYTTIAVAITLHVTGLFKLYTIIDEFGPLMSVAIISGFLVSIIAYTSALYRGAEHRMTGHHIYDFFMGAELNPRLFGLLDLKMFFEVRLPWYILFLCTCGAAARQYEIFGHVSGEVGFLLMAHFLYANACSKAEESIVTTW